MLCQTPLRQILTARVSVAPSVAPQEPNKAEELVRSCETLHAPVLRTGRATLVYRSIT